MHLPVHSLEHPLMHSGTEPIEEQLQSNLRDNNYAV